jgi:DNA modification methylase
MELNKVYKEPCLETLKRMPNDFLDSVVTSPPYWQLRDYGYEGQWGLEPTFEMYLENLWLMMNEIYRVLKPTGTVWINLGDTYGTKSGGLSSSKTFDPKNKNATINQIKQPKSIHKSLLLIPHRFAIGCMERGWIIRNDIVWAKRNGMPESVTDRFSNKHEYFFLMTKSEKYFFDLDSIREKHSTVSLNRYKYDFTGQMGGESNNFKGAKFGRQNTKYSDGGRPKWIGEKSTEGNIKGKNPGSVSDFWDIPTKPSSNEHYASYNDNLLRKPVLAGCPEGGVIYDPFMGTGSTAEVALRSNRFFIGSEMSEKYMKILDKRLQPFLTQEKLF